MNVGYFICDVFTNERFGGNPLAVIPNAADLSGEQMQKIAREFNFSESTFVLPAESGHTRRVRIFTPSSEIPFAGHPNVGTAFVLATIGEIAGGSDGEALATFEEDAGLVEVTITSVGGSVLNCELKAPQLPQVGQLVDPELAARAVGLRADDVVSTTHAPQVASVGLPFVMLEVTDVAALGRCQSDTSAMRELASLGLPPDVHVYAQSPDSSVDLQARMFAPLDGVPEDPATGSANCALVGLLSHCHPQADAELSWTIAQGIEMGRPSQLMARTRKSAGQVTETRIGGASVMFANGELSV